MAAFMKNKHKKTLNTLLELKMCNGFLYMFIEYL